MDDREFIGYCETHSETERALFNAPQIARLLRLAGRDAEAAEWEKLGSDHWRSCDLSEICSEARDNMKDKQ